MTTIERLWFKTVAMTVAKSVNLKLQLNNLLVIKFLEKQVYQQTSFGFICVDVMVCYFRQNLKRNFVWIMQEETFHFIKSFVRTELETICAIWSMEWNGMAIEHGKIHAHHRLNWCVCFWHKRYTHKTSTTA